MDEQRARCKVQSAKAEVYRLAGEQATRLEGWKAEEMGNAESFECGMRIAE